MRVEYRPEDCEECGWSRERQWLVTTLGKGTEVPAGFHIESRSQSGDWRTSAAPTRLTTLCGCDAP